MLIMIDGDDGMSYEYDLCIVERMRLMPTGPFLAAFEEHKWAVRGILSTFWSEQSRMRWLFRVFVFFAR